MQSETKGVKRTERDREKKKMYWAQLVHPDCDEEAAQHPIWGDVVVNKHWRWLLKRTSHKRCDGALSLLFARWSQEATPDRPRWEAALWALALQRGSSLLGRLGGAVWLGLRRAGRLAR